MRLLGAIELIFGGYMGRKKKKIEPIEEKPEVEEAVDNSAEEESMDEIPQIKAETNEKEFNKFVSSIEKEFGEGTIASADDIFFVEKVPTRNLLLDILTEGGLPKGSITLFYGPFQSGKTVTSLEIAAIFTSQKIPVLYIACEGDMDKNWIVKIGNDLKYFYVAKPKNLEDAINLAEVAVCSKKFGLVIFDSVTAGIPKEALDKKTENDQMALQARRNTKLVQKVTSALQPENLKDPDSYNNTMVILIAHLRHKVGFVMGSSESLPGGEALKHHSSYIIKVRGCAKLKDKEDIIGREMKFYIERSKYSIPFVSGTTEFYFNPPRFNNAKVLLTYASQYGIIERAGAYYSYKDIKTQGKKELLKELKEKGLLQEIKQKLIYKFSEEN